jgi:hypothetical protein
VNYYPEQLRRIAAMCEGLNKADGLETEGEGAVLSPRIKVVHPEAPDEVLGYLVDEIGGAWSFEPAAEAQQ